LGKLIEPRLASLRAGATLLVMVAMCAIGSCAVLSPQASAPDATCNAGSPTCPIDIVFTADHAEVSGVLSPKRRSRSYAFTTTVSARLQWVMSGPAVRTVLSYPDGNTDGPGLASVIALTMPGRYVFTVSSNTMAENIYGRFQIEFKILAPD
jgi:hypothetical protein